MPTKVNGQKRVYWILYDLDFLVVIELLNNMRKRSGKYIIYIYSYILKNIKNNNKIIGI
jgi:hypothetical protein